MGNNIKRKFSLARIVVTGGMLALAVAAYDQAHADPIKLSCTTNNDFFTNNCSIHVNAITRVTNGVASKGHLVGGQSKSYACINRICTEIYGGAGIPFDFAMTDLPKFCSLLLKHPPCSVEWK